MKSLRILLLFALLITSARSAVTTEQGPVDTANTWSVAQTFAVPIKLTGITYASLPTAVAGIVAYITDGATGNCGDSACTTIGTTVTGGGGSLKLLVWYNGTNWRLIGR